MSKYKLSLLALFGLVAAIAVFCGSAFAIPAPATPLPTELASVAAATPAPAPGFSLPNPMTVLTTAAGWGAWVLSHWLQLGELLGFLVAAYYALRARQWDKLVALAAPITASLAALSGYDNAGKRKVAVDKLYAKSNPLMRRLFSLEQFELAVETAYQMLTKPKLAVK